MMVDMLTLYSYPLFIEFETVIASIKILVSRF